MRLAATLVFVSAGRYALPSCAVRLNAHVRGVLDGCDLGRRFDKAKLGNQRRGIGHFAERIARSQLGCVVLGPRRVDSSMRAQLPVQLGFELLDGQDVFETCDRMYVGVLGRRTAPRVPLGAFAR